MSHPIHKQAIDSVIETPLPGKPIAFHRQRERPTVWYIANDERWSFNVYRTGETPTGEHIGTALFGDDGAFVLHGYATRIDEPAPHTP